MAKIDDFVKEQLKSGGFNKEQIAELSAAASKVHAAGLKGVRVLTKGIPVPDWVRVAGVADKATVAKLVNEILATQRGIGGLRLFPYGIPLPDIYQVEIDIGPGAPMGN